ncbi:MAG TPA: hypothetical protein DCS24_00755 [Erythrobacter sp.]|nr:hypothetical protein [Erythrobacter sp.]
MDESVREEAAASTNVTPPEAYSPYAVHMLRTAQVNTLTLSQMADQKASILMGATFLVFSILVSQSMVGDMSWTMIILAASAFLSSLCAVIAILPWAGKPKKEQGTPNKLFFGHFALRHEAEWVQEVLEDLETEEKVYRAMLHDIYQNGQVLHRRKYRFLGVAYRIFIAGLVATILSYLTEHVMLA